MVWTSAGLRLPISAHRVAECLVFLAVVALGGVGAALAADDRATPGFSEIVGSVLSDSAYQTELPQGPTTTRSDFQLPPEVVEALLWILAIAAVAWIGYLILVSGRRMLRRGPTKELSDPAPAPAETAAAPTPPEGLAEGDRLAGLGQHGAAIHAILLSSLEALRRRLAVDLAPSFTSRELIGRFNLPEPARSAFARIVSASELSHFGGRPASATDFRDCRTRYERLAAGNG